MSMTAPENALRTILVGTDLDERSHPAIVRGAELARASGARLIVCHVVPGQAGVHPLFPQRYQDDATASAGWEREAADAVTQLTVELTGLEAFDVVVDQGEPSRALRDQALRFAADLVVVAADRPGGERTVTRDLATTACSVLVVGQSSGDSVALVALESEAEAIPALARKARSAIVRPPQKFVVIMWADRPPEIGRAALVARFAEQSVELGAPLEPWFAEPGDNSLLVRVATDPEFGLVAMAAPRPDRIVEESTSPIDDALIAGASSILLVRS